MSGVSAGTKRAALLLAVVFLASVVLSLLALRQPLDVPDIQGVLIQQARPLPSFELTDHTENRFGRDDLLGRWHMLSYGFTHCPDICPATLAVQARLSQELDRLGRYKDLNQLFYSVDPSRDTPQHLAQYVGYFHPDMRALTLVGRSAESPEPFERGLGMVHDIPEGQEREDYQVNHGAAIYLINPQGALQAVFMPDAVDNGAFFFSPERLLEDYLSVREYLDN